MPDATGASAGRVRGPSILPLLPMIYVAWADGILTEHEVEVISARVRELPWLDTAARDALRALLDPTKPPTPTVLEDIRATVRRLATDLPEIARRSLAVLGLELARRHGGEGARSWTSPEAGDALIDLERALGVIGAEAVRELITGDVVHPLPPTPPAPSFDVEAMTAVLDGEWHETRTAVRSLLSESPFRYGYGLDTAVYQQRVLAWCRQLADRGLGALAYPREVGGAGNIGAFIAAFETLAFFDLSLVVKFGVQFGLFGGSIQQLGTARHHEAYLPAVGTLALPGCFAMTETGHGSNVRDIETTARFDPATDEFVIHTPTESARKDYIGNAAMHGRLATVFAQLELGDRRHGVHAFLVPIRSEHGTPAPGVRIEDCGLKLGLNGVDNGRLWFDHVRVPRGNLLDRFAQVSAAGEYSSPIPGASRRFFTMLGTLVGGRVSVACAGLSAAKSGLTIAIRYAAMRTQFGPAGGAERVLLDYRTHRRRLMPPLAATYATHFALAELVRRFANRTADDQREIETLAAGLKAHATWLAVETLQVSREACGGAGYLAENRFADLRADTDVFTTFEGDNTVLMQLVAKGLLTEFRQQFADTRWLGTLAYLGRRAATAAAELNPVTTRLTDEAHLRGDEFHRAALAYREDRLMWSLARRMKHRIDEGVDSFDAFNACQNHAVALAKAHVERVICEQIAIGARSAVDGLQEPLQLLRDLYALATIERDRAWFLESGYLSGTKAKAIRSLVTSLCDEAAGHAVSLVEAFGIPPTALGAPIATGAEWR